MLVTLTAKDQYNALRPNVLLKVFSGVTLITQGTTGALGTLVVDLAAGTYLIRLSYAALPYVTQDAQQAVVAAGHVAFTVRIEVLSMPPAVNPLYCKLSGYLLDNCIVAEQRLQFDRVWPNTSLVGITQITFLNRAFQVLLEENYGNVDLLRKNRYLVTLPDRGTHWWVTVPDLAAADLAATLFPMVHTITPDTVVANLVIGQELEITYSQQYYSGLELSSAELVEDGGPERQYDIDAGVSSMLFESDDTAIATVIDDGGVLRVTGVSAGTAHISVTLQDPWKSLLGTTQEWTDLIEVVVA